MNIVKHKAFVAIIISATILACSKEEESSTAVNNPAQGSSVPFQELYDQGIDRYLGVFVPSSTANPMPGQTEYFFDIPNGPICYTGQDFSMFTRDGSSDDLLIFLQGGGFCSPVACEAVEDGIPLVPFGILNPNDPQSPVANFDLGYVPYCDGSAMIGDAEVDSDGDGIDDRFFRGLQNLSASLDVIADRYPSPNRIVLAGNSAGGFAVHHALPLLRRLYPELSIYLINDSGVGLINPGGWQMLLNYWNGGSFIPNNCSDCIGADGNLTDYHKYQLEQDPNLRIAYISSKQDDTFAQMTQGGGPAFEAQLIEASNEMNSTYPDRFNSLIADGDGHTFLIREYDYQIAGTTVRDWLADMLSNNGNWQSKID